MFALRCSLSQMSAVLFVLTISISSLNCASFIKAGEKLLVLGKTDFI